MYLTAQITRINHRLCGCAVSLFPERKNVQRINTPIRRIKENFRLDDGTMITGYCCTNIFSEHAKELIEFYRQVLEIPFIKTDDDCANGVYLGFIENAPTLCIWDCKKYNLQPTGHQSFVFQTENLDLTMDWLKKKGVSLSEAIRYDWGTYEVRLSDIDGNEIVIAEFA